MSKAIHRGSFPRTHRESNENGRITSSMKSAAELNSLSERPTMNLSMNVLLTDFLPMPIHCPVMSCQACQVPP